MKVEIQKVKNGYILTDSGSVEVYPSMTELVYEITKLFEGEGKNLDYPHVHIKTVYCRGVSEMITDFQSLLMDESRQVEVGEWKKVFEMNVRMDTINKLISWMNECRSEKVDCFDFIKNGNIPNFDFNSEATETLVTE